MAEICFTPKDYTDDSGIWSIMGEAAEKYIEPDYCATIVRPDPDPKKPPGGRRSDAISFSLEKASSWTFLIEGWATVDARILVRI